MARMSRFGNVVLKRTVHRVRSVAAGVGWFLVEGTIAAGAAVAPGILYHYLMEGNRRLEGPPAGSPEVLCPEVPPSPVERELWSRLGAA